MNQLARFVHWRNQGQTRRQQRKGVEKRSGKQQSYFLPLVRSKMTGPRQKRVERGYYPLNALPHSPPLALERKGFSSACSKSLLTSARKRESCARRVIVS